MNGKKRTLLNFIPVILALTTLLTATSCDSSIGVNEQNTEIQSAHPNGSEYFNPQPEPPAKILSIEITGLPNGDWRGRFQSDEMTGQIQVETLSSKIKGKTIHLVQSWTLHPPDPIQPIQINMKGTLNLSKESIVMNGVKKTDSANNENNSNAHVRGDFATLANGSLSIGGELMFNPQPEPPARSK